MKRYENTIMKNKITKRGVKDISKYNITSKTTTVYENVPVTDNDIYVITQAGDRLDHLAHQFYGDVSLWWYIAKANNLVFMTVKTGTRLRIPATTQYALGK